jgi:hypothetical protein
MRDIIVTASRRKSDLTGSCEREGEIEREKSGIAQKIHLPDGFNGFRESKTT